MAAIRLRSDRCDQLLATNPLIVVAQVDTSQRIDAADATVFRDFPPARPPPGTRLGRPVATSASQPVSKTRKCFGNSQNEWSGSAFSADPLLCALRSLTFESRGQSQKGRRFEPSLSAIPRTTIARLIQTLHRRVHAGSLQLSQSCFTNNVKLGYSYLFPISPPVPSGWKGL